MVVIGGAVDEKGNGVAISDSNEAIMGETVDRSDDIVLDVGVVGRSGISASIWKAPFSIEGLDTRLGKLPTPAGAHPCKDMTISKNTKVSNLVIFHVLSI